MEGDHIGQWIDTNYYTYPQKRVLNCNLEIFVTPSIKTRLQIEKKKIHDSQQIPGAS